MTIQQLFASVLAAALLEGAAFAGTCSVQNSAAPGDWRFVHVYDVKKSEIVLRQAINGGDSKEVTVSGNKIRVDHKRAGNRNYATGPVTACKDGNTVKF
jgi:hypothetical protein